MCGGLRWIAVVCLLVIPARAITSGVMPIFRTWLLLRAVCKVKANRKPVSEEHNEQFEQPRLTRGVWANAPGSNHVGFLISHKLN